MSPVYYLPESKGHRCHPTAKEDFESQLFLLSKERAELIAHEPLFKDGKLRFYDRHRFLFRANGGGYILLSLACAEGRRSRRKPLSREEALSLWEKELLIHEMPLKEAFPQSTPINFLLITLQYLLEPVQP